MKNMYESLSKSLIVLLFVLLSGRTFAVSVTASPRGALPSCLVESSALDFTGGTHFWSLNDSGHNEELYRISNTGALTRTVTVTNATNRDWEEIAHDASRTYMYIGDFGNNLCDRTNLRVYRIPYPSTIQANTVAAEVINFSYPDQRSFPSAWMNFDAEAFFHFQGKLYIFTKADGSAIGYTKMYSIPDAPGNYTATLIDSFYTNDRITSGDISPDGSSVVLISNTHIHIFRNYHATNFFNGNHTQVNIAGGWTQKEGVSFSSNNEIYMTDENSGAGNQLYYVDLSPWIPASPVLPTFVEKMYDVKVNVYPMPANEVVNIRLSNVNSARMTFSLFDLTGKSVYEARIEEQVNPFTINTSDFPTGVYFYKVYADAKEIQTARLIISH
jgi:hypothetical protein